MTFKNTALALALMTVLAPPAMAAEANIQTGGNATTGNSVVSGGANGNTGIVPPAAVVKPDVHADAKAEAKPVEAGTNLKAEEHKEGIKGEIKPVDTKSSINTSIKK